MKRKKINQDWYFWEEKDSFALVWDVPEKAQLITLPHDAMLEKPANPESLNGGNTGFRDGGVYTYLKKLTIPETDKDQKLLLQFDGVYMNALVYINGQLAGKNPFGYSTFYVELNDFIHFGAENEIRVQARAGAMTNSRWYSGAGIYRDVYLLKSERTYIEPDQVRIKTKSIKKDYGTIEIATIINNQQMSPNDVTLEILLEDADGAIVSQENNQISLLGNETREVFTKLLVTDPKLWSVETPYLYNCKIMIKNDNQLIDVHETPFGIRMIEVDSKAGFQLNGETVKLRGACVHHDSGLLGAKTYEDAHRRQILKLKEAGFNAVRMSHHPMAPAMLKACDEIGMLVMDETFDIWTRCKSDYDYGLFFDEWWEKDVAAMVRKDYNHPSVILYSIGNEIPEIATDLGVKIASDIVKKIRSLDDTRYTLASINGVFAAGTKIDQIVADVANELKSRGAALGNVNSFMTLMEDHLDEIVCHPEISQALEKVYPTTDIMGYNYMTGRYEKDVKDSPNRIIVGSETYPPEIARNWELVKKYPALIGDFTWTGWDYLGEAGIGIPGYQPGEGGFGAAFPCQLAYTGDFDMIGFRRPMSYYREIVFGLREKPYIAVRNPYEDPEKLIKTPWVMSDSIRSWSWNIEEGQLVQVEIYATGDEIELQLDGQLIEKKPAGKELQYVTIFDVPYVKGTLSVKAYKEGVLIGEDELKSATAFSAIQISEPDYLGEELIYLPIILTDSEGCTVTNEDQELEAQVTGGAELIGFGSGNPKPVFNFNEGKTKTFNGRALAILKRKSTLEPIRLSVFTDDKKVQCTKEIQPEG